MWLNCLAVGIGGFFGATARYLLGLVPGYYYLNIPLGTMLINIGGAFGIGLIAGAIPLDLLPIRTQLFLKTGLCGGFTTFSTFSLETVNLMEQGHWGLAGGYAMGSLLLCMLGVFVGKLVMTHFAS